MALTSPQPAPRSARPIVVIGAGGIVADAHLPAYRLAGFAVAGICDLERAKAEALARRFSLPRVYAGAEEAVRAAPPGAVFDLAVPPAAMEEVVSLLPRGAPALLQKPPGRNLAEARRLRDLCRERGLKTAVNFQLRYAPVMAKARALIAQGALGEVNDLEVRVTVFTPWHLWPFLEKETRPEILFHSIHYLDLIRSFLGEPEAVRAQSVRHPRFPRLATSRTVAALDYGPWRRALVVTNHGHDFGPRHQRSEVKWEGDQGAMVARMGVLLDYPRGQPDALEIRAGSEKEWRPIPAEGDWFPHAFAGPMADLMRFADGEGPAPPTAMEDACRTMALVEAACAASAAAGTPVPEP